MKIDYKLLNQLKNRNQEEIEKLLKKSWENKGISRMDVNKAEKTKS